MTLKINPGINSLTTAWKEVLKVWYVLKGRDFWQFS